MGDTIEVKFTRTIIQVQTVTVPLHDEGEGRICWDVGQAMSDLDEDRWQDLEIEVDEGEVQ